MNQVLGMMRNLPRNPIFLARPCILPPRHACARAALLSTNSSPDSKRDKAAAERERLKKELGRLLLGGGLADVRAASKDEDSKVFPTALVNDVDKLPDSLRTFETLDGTPFTIPDVKRPTALLLAFNQLGWSMLDEWKEAIPVERANVLKVSIVEGWSARMFKGSLKSSMLKTVPTSDHSHVALWVGSFDNERAALDIDNRAIGYAFIVDSTGTVRLRGCGRCTDRDKSLIDSCINANRLA